MQAPGAGRAPDQPWLVAHLPRWVVAALVLVMFAGMPSVAHYLDLQEETDALQLTADAVTDLGREGPDFALGGPVR